VIAVNHVISGSEGFEVSIEVISGAFGEGGPLYEKEALVPFAGLTGDKQEVCVFPSTEFPWPSGDYDGFYATVQQLKEWSQFNEEE